MVEHPPQPTEQWPLERLELDLSEDAVNYFEFRGMNVLCELHDKSEDVGPRHPAMYAMTQDISRESGKPGGETLSVWVWEGVPGKFKEVLTYHELIEGYSRKKERMDYPEAHQAAKKAHNTYAKQFLSAEDLTEFETWQSQLPEGGF